MAVYLRSICTQLIFVLKALLTSYARHSLWVTIMLPFYYQDTCIITTCWIMLAPHLRLNDKCVNKFICHLTTLYILTYQIIRYLTCWYLNLDEKRWSDDSIFGFDIFFSIYCVKRMLPLRNIIWTSIVNDSSSIYVLSTLLDHQTNCDPDFSPWPI